MKSLEQWFAEYEVSHRNPTNIIIHKVCVPSIMFSVIGILWTIPIPSLMANIPMLNWASVFVVFALIWYFLLSKLYFFIMMIVAAGMLALSAYLDQSINLFSLSLIIFIVAWIGQFYGHKVEGKKPSFFKDLQFLFIGPLWVVSFFLLKKSPQTGA